MPNSHPVVQLRNDVDTEAGALDNVEIKVAQLEHKCTKVTNEDSNVSQITLLKGRADNLEISRATKDALASVNTTAVNAAAAVSALELQKVNVNETAIGENAGLIGTNTTNIALKASKTDLDEQTGRINGHDASLNALSLELDTKATKVALSDLSSNFHATKTEYGHTKTTVESHQRSINSIQQQIDGDVANLAENYYTQTENDITDAANNARFGALDVSVNLLRTDVTAAENKGLDNRTLIDQNDERIGNLSDTVTANKALQISKNTEIDASFNAHDVSLNALRQDVDEWDVLSKTEKASLAEVFRNMHKNWFAARSVATQNLVQNTDNELALADIISGAHEKFTINGNKFSVSESGYYSVSADITSVYAGATE